LWLHTLEVCGSGSERLRSTEAYPEAMGNAVQDKFNKYYMNETNHVNSSLSLRENDIPGASLGDRDPSSQKILSISAG